jgi:hypothetical protein
MFHIDFWSRPEYLIFLGFDECQPPTTNWLGVATMIIKHAVEYIY